MTLVAIQILNKQIDLTAMGAERLNQLMRDFGLRSISTRNPAQMFRDIVLAEAFAHAPLDQNYDIAIPPNVALARQLNGSNKAITLRIIANGGLEPLRYLSVDLMSTVLAYLNEPPPRVTLNSTASLYNRYREALQVAIQKLQQTTSFQFPEERYFATDEELGINPDEDYPMEDEELALPARPYTPADEYFYDNSS